MKLSQVFLASTALAASTAFAAVAPHGTMTGLPAEMVQGQVRFVSGGIGLDEARAFRHAERNYPLTLEFADSAKPRDEFTAGVRVVIRDAKGRTVLDTVSSGPFVLAKLPAGRYDIRATQEGKTLERHATVVEAKASHVGFLWPAATKPAG